MCLCVNGVHRKVKTAIRDSFYLLCHRFSFWKITAAAGCWSQKIQSLTWGQGVEGGVSKYFYLNLSFIWKWFDKYNFLQANANWKLNIDLISIFSYLMIQQIFKECFQKNYLCGSYLRLCGCKSSLTDFKVVV